MSFNKVATGRHGTFCYNSHDQYIGRAIERYGEYQENEIALFDRLINKGDHVLDVGANMGTHTVWFSKRVGDVGSVIAFEPQRLIYQSLCANLALNSLANVQAFQLVCGQSSSEIPVPVLDPNTDQNFGGLSMGAKEGEPIAMIPLDMMGAISLNFIKVDVEGMEEDVLRGARSLIERFKPILYVEYDREKRKKSLGNFILKDLEYAAFIHRPPLFNPDNYAKDDENEWPNKVSTNLLCFHHSVAKHYLPLANEFCDNALVIDHENNKPGKQSKLEIVH